MKDLNEEFQKATHLNTNFKKTNKLLKIEISPLLALENKFNIVKNNNKIDNSNQTGNKPEIVQTNVESNYINIEEVSGNSKVIDNMLIELDSTIDKIKENSYNEMEQISVELEHLPDESDCAINKVEDILINPKLDETNSNDETINCNFFILRMNNILDLKICLRH